MKYHDMVIEASGVSEERRPDARWWRRFKVRVLSSPAGEMAPDEAVACQYDDSDLKVQLSKLDAREFDQAGLIELGQLLGSLLLPDGPDNNTPIMRELFLHSLDLVGQDAGLRLRLRLPPELAALPWEYVYAIRAGNPPGMAGFLSLNPQVSIVRHEVLRAPVPSVRITGDIRMVAAFASPSAPDLDAIDLRREARGLREALGHRPAIKVEYLMKAKLEDVEAAIIPGAGVFHFAGHAKYRTQPGPLPRTTKGWGELVLEDKRVDAETFAINLHRNGVRLVVLNSCETGRGDGLNIWGGIAAALVRCAVPAVLANQYTIRHECAIEFSRQFYRALVGGLPIERAVTAGRVAAYSVDPDGRDWGVPVLYLRADDGELFEGAVDAHVRDSARAAVEELVVQQSVNILQQHVEIIQHKFGNMIANLGGSSSLGLKQSTLDRVGGAVARSTVDVASSEKSEDEGPSEAASTAPTEEWNSQSRMQLAAEALRPALLKLIAGLERDDLPLVLQFISDLSYELARDREADVGLIGRLVSDLVALVPGVVGELRDLFSREDFRNLAPSAALMEGPHRTSASHAAPPRS